MIDLKKALGIFALASALVAGVVLAQGQTAGTEKPAGKFQPGGLTQDSNDETCPVDPDSGERDGLCFLRKLFRLNEGFSQTYAGQELASSEKGARVKGNMMTGMAGLFALGQKCMSDVAANLTAFTRTGS